MNVILIYFWEFILFGYFGYLFESVIFGKKGWLVDGVYLLFYPIYGIGVLILIGLGYAFEGWPLVAKAVIATLIITFFECLAGKLRYLISKKSTWNYSFMSACSGYISIPVSVMWFLFILLFYYVQPLFINNL